MKFPKNTERFKKLSKKQWEDWNDAIFSLFWKLWIIILLVQLFLFLFYRPIPEFHRIDYFLRYIFLPSGLEAVSLICVRFIFTRVFPSYKRRVVSAYTILLSSIFAGVTVCVHTSVEAFPALLLLPMMLTPLYRDVLMTFLQAVLVILLYLLNSYYFIPNTSFTPPENTVSPYLELSVFVGAVCSTCIILWRVNETIVLNEERSKHDSLTHLYNHENFYMELDFHRNRFEKYGICFSVIIADIDDFKKVNDVYGHAFGDEVIRKVGELFLLYGGEEAFCARYGGEEFAMILSLEDPMPVAEEIRKAFEAVSFETPSGVRHFTLSIGAAVYDRSYPSGGTFFEKADSALYFAKKQGKNRVVMNGCSDQQK